MERQKEAKRWKKTIIRAYLTLDRRAYHGKTIDRLIGNVWLNESLEEEETPNQGPFHCG